MCFMASMQATFACRPSAAWHTQAARFTKTSNTSRHLSCRGTPERQAAQHAQQVGLCCGGMALAQQIGYPWQHLQQEPSRSQLLTFGGMKGMGGGGFQILVHCVSPHLSSQMCALHAVPSRCAHCEEGWEHRLLLMTSTMVHAAVQHLRPLTPMWPSRCADQLRRLSGKLAVAIEEPHGLASWVDGMHASLLTHAITY